MQAVELRAVSKQFGPVTALDGITLQVPAGSIYGLLGINGAGKTTLMRILMGFLRPTTGDAVVLGHSVRYLAPAVRARIGYVPERPVLHPQLTVAELFRLLRAVQPRWDQTAADRFVTAFRLPVSRRIRDLSAGMVSQLALGAALSAQPELLLLDDPAAGLDPVARRRYLQVLLEESAVPGHTILMASHDLALVERACDHVALIDQGRVQVAGPIEDLLAAEKRLRVVAPPATVSALRAVPGVRSVRPEGHGFLVTGRFEPETVRAVSGVSGVEVFRLSLEQLFWSYAED